MVKNRKTSKRDGSLAGKGLRGGHLTKKQLLSVIACDLSQRAPKKKKKSKKK